MSANRRDRVVMVLGLAALLLFAANLLSFLDREFFGHDRYQQVDIATIEHDHAVHAITVTPNVDLHSIRIKRFGHVRDRAIAEVRARLAEEVARLAEESARLSENGHSDAAASLQETVDQLTARLAELAAEADGGRSEMSGLQLRLAEELSSIHESDGTTETLVLTAPTAPDAPAPVVIGVSRAGSETVSVSVAAVDSNQR